MVLTGVDDQSRANDDNRDRPLDYRRDQKIATYAKLAEENVFPVYEQLITPFFFLLILFQQLFYVVVLPDIFLRYDLWI